jgi:hypothetical protein
VLNEEEAEDDFNPDNDEETVQDESMDNDDEAEDADDHEVKAVTVSKKKVGRNYKKLSSSDAKFADRVGLLLKYCMGFAHILDAMLQKSRFHSMHPVVSFCLVS